MEEYPDHVTVLHLLKDKYCAAVMRWETKGERYYPVWAGPHVSKVLAEYQATAKAEELNLKLEECI